MVTVDMSKTRQQISKRKRRLRRLQRRRLHKAHRQHHAQLLAATAAKKARQKSVQKWLEDEKRRDHERVSPSSPSTPQRKPRVRFADNVFVTEIPALPQHSLPKPVSSPTGVKLLRQNPDHPLPAAHLVHSPNTLRFSLFSQDDNDYDENQDPDFVPPQLPQLQLPSAPRPKRRLFPQCLPVSSSPPSKATKAQSKHPPTASPASLPPKPPTTLEHKPSKHVTQLTTNLSTLNSTATKKSLKRKRDHPQLFADHLTPSPQTSSSDAQAVQATGEHTTSAESPKRRKKKKRKLASAVYNDPIHHQNSKSPVSTELESFTTKHQFTSSESDHQQKSSRSTPNTVNGTLAKQKDAVVNTDDDDSDIDAMFGEMVRHKAQMKAEQHDRKKMEQTNGEKRIREPEKERSQKKRGPARYTEEGFRILSYDDIKADQPSGLNGDCPFDCSCCF